MSVNTSRTILKVFGVIGIVIGLIACIASIVVMLGGGLVGIGTGDLIAAGSVIAIGFVGIITGLITLIQGACAHRASKDTSKIMPAWIFSVISLISNLINLITLIKNDSLSFATLFPIAVSVLIFAAADTIKKRG